MTLIHCSKIEYDTVGHELYADGEMIAETWREEIPGTNVDSITLTDDVITVTGEFVVVYDDNYEIQELR